MNKLLKTIIFIIILFITANILAFFLKDDSNTYSRLVMQDFYNQEQIDYLFCGASHVSHGINPELLTKNTKQNVFCAGTSAQKISTTYYIIKEAIHKYKLKTIFVDLDFEMAIGTPEQFFNKHPSKDIYIVSSYLQNPIIKTQYLLSATSPKYWFNSFFPLGVQKDISLNPKTIIKNIKLKILTKDYYKYNYKSKDSIYLRGGAVINNTRIKNGSFYEFEENIKKIPNTINSEWQYYVEKIINLCEKNNVKLDFYSAPMPDYYLNISGDYDLYNSFVKTFLGKHGYKFYDFNLCKPEYLSLEDSDFYDFDHLNKYGIHKFTNTFSNFLTEKDSINNFFFSSYKEKKEKQAMHIYGILLQKESERNCINIIPIINHDNQKNVTFDIYGIENGYETILYKNSTGKNLFFKPSKKIRICSYYNYKKQNDIIIEDLFL